MSILQFSALGRTASAAGGFLLIIWPGLDLAPASAQGTRIECVAGCGQGAPGGPARHARLIEPFGVAFDKDGNWYICEYKGQRITRVDRQGAIRLFAGREPGSAEPEGDLAGQIQFKDPHGLVISRDGKMYVADTLNHRVVRIDLDTNRAATITGTGRAGFSGDGGSAKGAEFDQLYAVDINRDGDKLFLTDLRNRRVRLLNLKSGMLSTIAGNGQEGIPQDGADAVMSPLVDPRATAVDSKGNVYILERRGNALRVLDGNGKIRTLIGPDRPGDRVTLNGPKHLCIDLNQNVIIADSENHLIRRYYPRDGKTVVIAGTGEKGDRIAPDDPLRTQLNRPHGVFVHPSGDLYISDSDNHRVLKLAGGGK